jgi:hypothetical protein
MLKYEIRDDDHGIGNDLIPIASLANLEKLYLTSRKLRTLFGIETFHNLTALDLYNCPYLESLAGVEKCPKRVEFEIEACRHISKERLRTHNKAMHADGNSAALHFRR